MLLNNNGPVEPALQQHQQQQQGVNGVFRRPKHDPARSNNNNNNNMNNNKQKKSGGKSAGGGTSSVRNSWSFATELPVHIHAPVQQHQQQQQVKESIYADPELLYNGNSGGGDPVKAVSRSRLRQRSVSNLTASSLSGLRASRDHSSSNARQNGNGSGGSGSGGTISAKGVDYIRMAPATPGRASHMLAPPPQQQSEMTVLAAEQPIQDRSEYGNPDGSSAHSTAEREGGNGSNGSNSINKLAEQVTVDLYQAINQNQNNDYKMSQGYFIHPVEVGAAEVAPTNRSLESQKQQQQLVRNGSGRSSATTTSSHGFPSSRAEVRTNSGSRKSTAAAAAATTTPLASTGPNAVKTEWTFLPSPTAEPVHHREINSKPEESSMVRKGLLWVMRDRLFSRYHERFCILTRNYLHCFKKGSEANLTQMGTFLFKVNLAEVIAVQWLDKRGTAIVCLTLAKEGRLLVKTSMDLHGWFEDLQNGIKETIGRRQTLLMDHQQRGSGSGRSGETLAVQNSGCSPNLPDRRPVSTAVAATAAATAQVAYRDRSLAARNRSSANRYSMVSDHELKLSAAAGPEPAEYRATPPAAAAAAAPVAVASISATATPSVPTPMPVPVPYRERSVSFDRSRISKAERETKRRSYYPSNHVTQV